MVKATNHMDTGICCSSSDDEVENLKKSGEKAQDLHKMLKVIFGGHTELQDSGFCWDLRHQGKTHKNIEFVFFTPFLKVDSDEAKKIVWQMHITHCKKCEATLSMLHGLN